jgi:SAM-dependent methyltransferase
MNFKEIIKIFIPKRLLDLRFAYLKAQYRTEIRDKSPVEIFNFIYKNKKWGNKESISGNGSSLKQTATISRALPIFLNKYNIQSILDLPCGDFHWMQHVDLQEIKYIGADIVEEIVQNNNRLFQSTNRRFIKLDIINDELPKVDLILCRDCFGHFSDDLIFQSIKNLRNQGFKYLLTTSFTNKTSNHDIHTGEWRPINVEIAPFFLKVVDSINENSTEGGIDFSDKSLVLVELTYD